MDLSLLHKRSDSVLNQSINENIKLKSKILSILFGFIFIMQLLGLTIATSFVPDVGSLVDNIGLHNIIFIPLLVLIMMLCELSAFNYSKRAILSNKTCNPYICYLVSFFESSFPSVFLYFACILVVPTGQVPYYDIMSGPPIFFYVIFIIISSLLLDPRLSVFVGLVSAVEYFLLLIYFMHDQMTGIFFPLVLSRCAFFLICGVISGMVSLKIRNSVLLALDAKNELIHNLDARVQEKTKEIMQQNMEIEHKNELLSEKNKNITDSINYAQRIQNAILPPDYLIKQHLPDSFILYLPKDVVSGDFYFVESLDETIVFAAVDCTGHGVPGALMSVVGFNYLTQAVRERGITKPSEILKFLDAGVHQTLRQSVNTGVKDGMDLALCSLNTKTLELQYSGAYNPAWIIHKSDGNPTISELKADKFPIGTNQNGESDEYTNHAVFLKPGDSIYLFSDGYADQFGGPKEKKFKYSQLEKVLLLFQNKTMDEQREILRKTIVDWMGGVEQTDDICIVGVKV